MLLQTGVAPTNTEWLNQLNTAYGAASSIGTIEDCIRNGLLTETSSGLVDTGLSNAIASASEYTSLGINELFETTVSDLGVSPASGAVNLANTAINVGTAGTIGAYAGAATVGVGVGVLINKAYNFLKRWVAAGMPINYKQPPAAVRPEGYENLAFVNYKHFGVMTQEFFSYIIIIPGLSDGLIQEMKLILDSFSVYCRSNRKVNCYNGLIIVGNINLGGNLSPY